MYDTLPVIQIPVHVPCLSEFPETALATQQQDRGNFEHMANF